jgi:hypothetical protein
MNLTNAQRGDIIDALRLAISLYKGLIESEPTDPEVDEMTAAIKRFRKLRRQYLEEERAQPPARVHASRKSNTSIRKIQRRLPAKRS